MLDKETLHELFEYRDGDLYWKIKLANNIRIGDKAGCFTSRHIGVCCRINDKLYKTNRIIFMMFHGYVPELIDYIDCDKFNNRIENLREATPSETMCNRKKTATNTSGYKGVSWVKPREKWMASISTNKFRIFYR
jgi:hypothetical protein